MKILIAEDDTTTRLMLEAMLAKLGHEAVATGNGRQAWKAFRTDYFPVVISDWMMPEIDGLMLCREIRRQPGQHYTNFILLTSRGSKADFREAMDAGVDDFMTKPVDEEQLAARLLVTARQLGLRHHVSRIEGLLPICANCKRIRDEQSQWKSLDAYMAERSAVTFTHGICPACEAEYFRQLPMA